MKKLIFNNIGLKLASLILAAILWFVVVQIEDPKDSKTYSNIQVKIINSELLDKENKVYEILDNSDIVSVTVRAPKSMISQIRAGDIVAEADMSKLTDINTIAITYSIQNVDVDYSITGNHEVVKLNVEERGNNWIAVRYGTIGEVADGYMVAGVSPDQTMIEVSGPKSIVDQVGYASVQIDVTGASSNRAANVDVVLYDKDDNVMNQSSLTKNVEHIHMTAEILATKDVPVEVGYMGVPEKNYMATGEVLCNPETVKIAGTPVALSSVNKIVIPEDRINITGANEDMTEVINIKEFLPDNIRLADSSFNGKVSVTVYIEEVKQEEIEIPERNIKITNIPEEYTVELVEMAENYVLTLSGFESEINQIKDTPVIAYVDIREWMETEAMEELKDGVYFVPAKFIFNHNSIEYNTMYVKVAVTQAQ